MKIPGSLGYSIELPEQKMPWFSNLRRVFLCIVTHDVSAVLSEYERIDNANLSMANPFLLHNDDNVVNFVANLTQLSRCSFLQNRARHSDRIFIRSILRM